MKAVVELSIVIAGMACLYGCTASVSPPMTAPLAATLAASTCPPDGSFVPFSKIMNDAFVADYQECNITTTAKFLRSGGMEVAGLAGQIIITATFPGDQFPYNVALPKQGGDLAFTLKPGDTILLRGGTYIPGLIDFYGNSSPMKYQKTFVATSIERAK